MPPDLDLIRSLYEVHNSAGADFPDILTRDYLHPECAFVEAAPTPGTHHGREAVAALFRDRFETGEMTIDDLELTPLDEHRVLASFRVHMRGTGSGAEAAMRIWNLLTLEGSRVTRVEEFIHEEAALAAARG